MRNKLALIIIIGFVGNASAQLGGKYIFQALDFSPSARATALGGAQIAVIDNDLSLTAQNPALLNKEMHNHASLSFADYLADAGYGYLAYARNYDSIFTLSAGFNYVNYGDFKGTDEYGNFTKTFSASDYNLNFSGATSINRFQFGASINLIWSQYEDYSAFAFALDGGATYHSKDSLFVTSVVIQNLGIQLDPFENGANEDLPLNVMVGATKKFPHMPLRFGVVIHHINVPDMTYDTPLDDNQIDFETGQKINQTIPFSEKVFRHFIFNGELVFSKNFHLRFAYNHQRRKELALENKKGLAGYSFGFGIRVYRFHLDYAFSQYHLAGQINHFTITSNLSEWF